jgi:hypothetical protein
MLAMMTWAKPKPYVDELKLSIFLWLRGIQLAAETTYANMQDSRNRN